MDALKSEQLRGSPSLHVKTLITKAHAQVHDPNNGVDFLGFANTLHFTLSLFNFNFGPTVQDTEYPKMSEFARVWLADCKEANEHFITKTFLELNTLYNHNRHLQQLVCYLFFSSSKCTHSQ